MIVISVDTRAPDLDAGELQLSGGVASNGGDGLKQENLGLKSNQTASVANLIAAGWVLLGAPQRVRNDRKKRRWRWFLSRV